MEIISKTLSKDHNIILASCFHEGTRFQHEEGIKQMIEYLKSEKDTYLIIGGDLVEAITVDDPRFDLRTVDERADKPLRQYLSIINKLRPIMDKIIVILMGNHDWYLSRTIGNAVRDIVCSQLQVPYGSYTCKIAVLSKNNKIMYKIFYTHGHKSITSTADDPLRRESNMKLILKRQLQHKAGDCLIMAKAHSHKLIVAKPSTELYLIDDGRRVKQRYTYDLPLYPSYIDPNLRWYCCTGSFLKLYSENVDIVNSNGDRIKTPISGYGEIGEYDPVELGYILIKVREKQVQCVEKIIL